MAAERREHRLALEILYAIDVGKTEIDEALRQARDHVGVFNRGDEAQAEDPYEPVYPAVERRAGTPKPTDWGAVETLVRGTLTHQADVRNEIAPLLHRWKLGRLSGIDRLILEMGAWELRYRPAAQVSAVINHCVELARRLSTEKSAHFVNAVLDALSKTPSQSSSGSPS